MCEQQNVPLSQVFLHRGTLKKRMSRAMSFALLSLVTLNYLPSVACNGETSADTAREARVYTLTQQTEKAVSCINEGVQAWNRRYFQDVLENEVLQEKMQK